MAYEKKDYSEEYKDTRLTDVKKEEAADLSDLEKAQAAALAETDKFVTDQQNAIAKERDAAFANQEENYNFTIEKIEQDKEQAHKDYIKEQSGAYADWQKESDPYGVNAEHRASSGMGRSGYSESSQVAMYNTYQNRVASARSAYELVVLDYKNGIREAQLQNNVALAEIRSNALQQQLQIALQGFQYKNQLIQDFSDRKMQAKSMALTKWKAVLDQINSENALEEQQRQYEASHALDERQVALAEDKWQYEKKQMEDARIAVENEEKAMKEDLRSLGYGGKSDEEVMDLVKEGKIVTYTYNGSPRFASPEDVKGREIVKKLFNEATTLDDIVALAKRYRHVSYINEMFSGVKTPEDVLTILTILERNGYLSEEVLTILERNGYLSNVTNNATSPANVGNVANEEYSRIINTPVEERTDLDKEKLKKYLDKAEKETTNRHR